MCIFCRVYKEICVIHKYNRNKNIPILEHLHYTLSKFKASNYWSHCLTNASSVVPKQEIVKHTHFLLPTRPRECTIYNTTCCCCKLSLIVAEASENGPKLAADESARWRACVSAGTRGRRRPPVCGLGRARPPVTPTVAVVLHGAHPTNQPTSRARSNPTHTFSLERWVPNFLIQ